MVELGFTKEYEDRNVSIRNDKLKYICNIDKTCIYLDGSNGNRGGRKAAVFFDPWFPIP